MTSRTSGSATRGVGGKAERVQEDMREPVTEAKSLGANEVCRVQVKSLIGLCQALILCAQLSYRHKCVEGAPVCAEQCACCDTPTHWCSEFTSDLMGVM